MKISENFISIWKKFLISPENTPQKGVYSIFYTYSPPSAGFYAMRPRYPMPRRRRNVIQKNFLPRFADFPMLDQREIVYFPTPYRS